ncbi:hypothetical protein L1887_02456 [Cichorium endivia]|nr:hypothetical protein L1887_02456 [Cichorium endivia]
MSILASCFSSGEPSEWKWRVWVGKAARRAVRRVCWWLSIEEEEPAEAHSEKDEDSGREGGHRKEVVEMYCGWYDFRRSQGCRRRRRGDRCWRRRRLEVFSRNREKVQL